MSGITRWWLIRHAPVINPGGKVYGQRDVPADVSDAASFAALAGALPPDAVWMTTTLSRTKATAAAILAAWTGPGAPKGALPAEAALLEQSFGDWQGLSHGEVRAVSPFEAHRFWLAPATGRPPGGESFADVVDRVAPALDRLSVAHAGRDVVAVTHGGTIRAALTHALGIDPDRALAFRIDTLSLTRIDAIRTGDGLPLAWRVAGVNLPPGSAPAA